MEVGTMRKLALTLILITVLFTGASQSFSHCQIPCGIYDDELRVQLIEEHIGTIEKSMKQVQALSRESSTNWNQIVRWISNKEHHAQEIQDIVTAYFMAQRIKAPTDGDEAAKKAYVARLTLLHKIQVQAMKAKQGTDLETVAKLRLLVAEFRTAYFGKEAAHTHS
jgi:nickel superoxide dismutase